MSERNNILPISAVILAAGAGTRMQSPQPKQLLLWRERPLLQHVLDAANASRCADVFTVLGFEHNAIQTRVDLGRSTVIVNEHWQEGMSASIRAALAQQPSQNSGVLFLLGDQPLVTTELIDEIAETLISTDCDAVACSYGKGAGVPAAFDQRLFPSLMQLKGDMGARAILQSSDYTVRVLAVAAMQQDIDTPADWQTA